MGRLRPPERDIGLPRPPFRAVFALLAGFCVIVLVFALFERAGIEVARVPEAVMTAVFVLFVLVALAAHGRRPVDYYVADHAVSAALGGLGGAAIFAGLMLVGLAGGIYASAAEIITSASSLLLGFVLLAVFVAPPLRRFGGYSVGDFLAARFGGSLARLLFALIAFASSFLLLLALIKTAQPLLTKLFGLSAENGLYAVAAVMVLVPLSGGVRSLTWTQAIQYFVIVLACVLPIAFLSGSAGTSPAASAATQTIGPLLDALGQALDLGQAANIAGQVLLLAVSFASLPLLTPQILSAFGGREAAASLMWSCLFSVMLLILGVIFGNALAEATDRVGAIGAGRGLLALALPLIAALPSILAGLVMAGALAALFAAGQAALLAATNAFSHDVWDEVLDRRGPAGRRLLVARLAQIIIAVGVCAIVLRVEASAPLLLGWAMALAAAGYLVPLVLGLWWRRCTAAGGTLGMMAGTAVAVSVFLHDHVLPAFEGKTSFGSSAGVTLGILAALLVTVTISLMTTEPAPDVQALVGRLHRPGPLPSRERPA